MTVIIVIFVPRVLCPVKGSGGGVGLSPRLSSPDPGTGRQHPPPLPAWPSIFLTELKHLNGNVTNCHPALSTG